MAGTIAYLYDPNQTVWVIDEVNEVLAVREGKVVRVRAEVLITSGKLVYDVRVGQEAGTKEFVETNLFATLADAVAEYELRLA